VDDFERDYLRLSAAGYRPDDLFFSSGPGVVDEPLSSVSVGHIVEYRAMDVAAGIAALPGFVNTLDQEYGKIWRSENGPRWVEIDVDETNTGEDGVWLASPVRADCTFADLVTVWAQLRRTFPAVYLHDPVCRMYTPRSFIEEVAVATLAPAVASLDPPTAGRAAGVYEEYRRSAGPMPCRRGGWYDRVPHAARSVFDLEYPVGTIRCNDRWTGRDWEYRGGEFDRAAATAGLRYAAYPVSWTVGIKYRSGFVVWCPLRDLVTARGIADRLGLLSAGGD
jgi:hypothetical protein